ncbi:MAG: NUDIX hydrolase [Solirubrobacterales bacterium]
MGNVSDELAAGLGRALLSNEEAEAIDAHGQTEAAVLVPLYEDEKGAGLVFTERRSDLRRHAGEISFPGGRRDHPSEELERTALREAEEEIGLDPTSVEVVGALPPIGTFVTSYKVHPFVGLIPAGTTLAPNPTEVAAILHLSIDTLRDAYEMRRLVRRGVPFKTPTYEVERHLIWGATARILEMFLERFDEAVGSA